MSVAEIIEADERRHARDAYRDAGGSKRRPLRSFLTEREKREARDDHAARIRLAVAELADPIGFERWAESLMLNPHLTPMNAALVALQSPGEIAGSAAYWKRSGYRVGKGERCAGRITARGFWPLAYFTTGQVNAGDLEAAADALTLPDTETLERLREGLAASLAAGDKAREALESIAGQLVGDEAAAA